MSHDMATTPTPLLMVICSCASSVTKTVVLGCNRNFTLERYDSATTADAKGHTRVIGLTTVPQQLPQPQMPFRHIPTMPWVLHRYVSHSELSLSPCDLPIHIGVYYGVFFLHLGTTVDAILPIGLTIGVCNTAALQSIPMASICTSW